MLNVVSANNSTQHSTDRNGEKSYSYTHTYISNCDILSVDDKSCRRSSREYKLLCTLSLLTARPAVKRLLKYHNAMWTRRSCICLSHEVPVSPSLIRPYAYHKHANQQMFNGQPFLGLHDKAEKKKTNEENMISAMMHVLTNRTYDV